MSIFKAYDIRGLVPDELDEKLAEQIGIAFTNILQEETNKTALTLLTARDMRPSGHRLIDALHAGITKAGADVIDINMTTTPMFYYAVGFKNIDGGLVCTASHNPAQYNGFKLVRKQSVPVSADTGIKEIEKRIREKRFRLADKTGTIREETIYAAYAKKILSLAENTDKKLKVAIDAGNGMAGLYIDLFVELGFEIIPLFFRQDGTFPNHEANPLKHETLTTLQKVAKTEKTDFSVAFDGDADRAIFLDETGKIIPADFITALISTKILEKNKGAVIIYDVRSSRIVKETIEQLGGIAIRERVGHSFIKARMRKENSIFGGELSGHYYFETMYTTDNALLACVNVANILRRRNEPLSQLIEPFKKYRQSGEINFRVEDKKTMMQKLADAFSSGEIDWVDGVTVQFDSWWFNVRPSNTEPLLRLNLEASTDAELSERLNELKRILGNPI